MNNYELDEQAKELEDKFSKYALARMYIEKCGDYERVCDKVWEKEKLEKHLLAEIEKWKYILDEGELELQEARRQLGVMRGF